MKNAYKTAYQKSLNDPEGFWEAAAQEINWTKKWDKVLDSSNPPFYRWFSGGETNTCYNALDRHVQNGRAEQLALIYDSPAMDGTVKKYTYRKLRDNVATFAGVLAELGVSKGDRIIIYMPMVPEAVIAMLAAARLGAVHSVVFGGFAANELATRIDDAKPKVIISASCGIEPNRVVEYKPLLDNAIEAAAHKVNHCVILQRYKATASMIKGRDVDWETSVASAAPHDCVPVKATDPLYILYTSGTTGQPKGIVRDNGGHMVSLKWSMKNIYNVNPGDVYWAASDIGWVVGHSYIVYAPLLHGCTTVLYEGKPVGMPDAGAFWRVVSEHKVQTLFTAPTAFRAIKREDPNGAFLNKYDMSHFKILFLAGERTDPDTLHWAENKLRTQVIDHWWQTESGWPMAANCMGLHAYPVKPGSSSLPVPGFNIQILNDENQLAKAGDIGSICAKLPLPPGCLTTLWNGDERYKESYLVDYPGYYKSGDTGFIDKDGYLFVMGRTDDIINVAGHRLSTGAMEEVLSEHPDVAECAVIGVADQLKGQLPLGFLVLSLGVDRTESDITDEVVAMIRNRIGPVAAFKIATIVARLPKTRSGKILRATMQKIADSVDYSIPATIDDPAILDEIKEALKQVGYARG